MGNRTTAFVDTILSRLLSVLRVPCQVIGATGAHGRTAEHEGPLMERYPLLTLHRRWPWVRLPTQRDTDGTKPAKLVLHRFLRGDDRELGIHNHPWRFASVVLSGSYTEVYIGAGGEVLTRTRGTGSVAAHEPSYQHMVTGIGSGGPCWTLALLWPRTEAWGFPERGRVKRAEDGSKVS